MKPIASTAPVELTVRVLKYDGAEYRRWNARLARQEGSLLILDAEFDFDVDHESLGAISKGARTVEYYWLDRWYNVFRFLNNGGDTRLYYCNINTPPVLEGDTLSYVDLDIDILVQPDFSFEVLDLDEFEVNAAQYGYSSEVKNSARAAVDELISVIEKREFPFTEKRSAWLCG